MRILIAEDDPSSLMLLKAYLEAAGHEVIACSDGRDVLGKLFLGALPQLVILDWMMPGVDGLEVCRQIRARPDLPYTHILLLTSRRDSSDVIHSLRAGANDYMTKPLELSELQSRLQVAMQMIELNNLVNTQRLRMVSVSKMAVLGEMAGGVAHEINNPLAIIMGQVYQLKLLADKKDASPELVDKYLKAIQNSAERVAKIVKGLQLFSAQGDDDPFVPVTVRSLFETVGSFCGAKARSLKIDLRIPDVPEHLALPAQRMQLCQAILNLIQNSIDATEGHNDRWIELDAKEDTQSILISVTDNGSGIPEEIRPKIMNPFFTTRPVGKGTGLGLSTAKGIVDAHGGKLTLDTTSPRTRFVISLPKSRS